MNHLYIFFNKQKSVEIAKIVTDYVNEITLDPWYHLTQDDIQNIAAKIYEKLTTDEKDTRKSED